MPAALGPNLAEAADAAGETWRSWQAVARSWSGSSREASPLAAEFTDLVIWVGRLARDNPAWTPSRADASVMRDPALLAPDDDQLDDILQALLQAATAIAGTARQDTRNVKLIAHQRGLYIPTRLAAETRMTTSAYQYGHAPPAQIDTMLDLYAAAIRHSRHAVTTLTNAAASTRSAETATTPELATLLREYARVRQCLFNHREPANPGLTDHHPDQLQQLLAKLRIDDPDLSLRAGAIDTAATNLAAEARAAASQRDQTDREVAQMRGPPSQAEVTQPRRQAGLIQRATDVRGIAKGAKW